MKTNYFPKLLIMSLVGFLFLTGTTAQAQMRGGMCGMGMSGNSLTTGQSRMQANSYSPAMLQYAALMQNAALIRQAQNMANLQAMNAIQVQQMNLLINQVQQVQQLNAAQFNQLNPQQQQQILQFMQQIIAFKQANPVQAQMLGLR